MMINNVITILQARYSSSRLPGKVLLPIMGRAMLDLQIERIRRATKYGDLIVATSADPSDDDIERLCSTLGVRCFRGNLHDVLDRFYQAATKFSAQNVVRLTGDCPLIDPQVIDKVISLHLDNGYDYTSNVRPPTFPDGLDVEVCKFPVLELAWKKADVPSEREHVMPFITTRPAQFRLGNLTNDQDLSALRWTVDQAEDFQLVRRIYESLYPQKPDFNTLDILELVKSSGEFELNQHVRRNAGYLKSLSEDQQHLAR